MDHSLDVLSRAGYGCLTVSGVAASAGTTRQAVYRRWPERAGLARAAVDRLAARTTGASTGAVYDDLVTELTALQKESATPTALGVAGAMMLLDVPAEVRSRYRQRVTGPHQRRLRRLLERAVAEGHLPAEADVELGVLSVLGALQAAWLIGHPAGRRWPERAAGLLWRSLGGVPPRRPRPVRKGSR